MSSILSLGQNDFWKVKNSIYAEFVSLVLQQSISPAAAQSMQLSEYVNGLDLVGLKSQDDDVATELVATMVAVATAISTGDCAFAGDRPAQTEVREKFDQLVRLLRGSSLPESRPPPPS